MSRKYPFAEDEYYHVYNRGVEKRVIFKTQKDKLRFQRLLYLCNSTRFVQYNDIKHYKNLEIYKIDKGDSLVDIGIYCMMGNHYHLLLKEHTEGGISAFMHKLSTAYTMYFNTGYQRTGSLFEGRFRSRHVTHDAYLKYLYAYIHLNSVQHIEPKWKVNGIQNKEKVLRYLENYRYSSFVDYCNSDRDESTVLTKEAFPNYFGSIKAFENEMDEWLSYISDKPAEY